MEKRNPQTTLGIIGIGNMGTAFLQSLLDSNGHNFQSYAIFDVLETRVKKFQNNPLISVCTNISEVIQSAQTILLVVKPQNMQEVLEEIRLTSIKGKNFVTVAMGLPRSFYENILGTDCFISRVMPNTPYLVGEGAAGITVDPRLSGQAKENILHIFSLKGKIVEIKEELMDVVTGLSGNGPAYFFIIVEALADGAVKMGLSREDAYLLTAQTMLGSAKMLLETGIHPGVLKDMVTSPGGTAIASISVLEREKIRSTLIEAVVAGTKKSLSFRELQKNQ